MTPQGISSRHWFEESLIVLNSQLSWQLGMMRSMFSVRLSVVLSVGQISSSSSSHDLFAFYRLSVPAGLTDRPPARPTEAPGPSPEKDHTHSERERRRRLKVINCSQRTSIPWHKRAPLWRLRRPSWKSQRPFFISANGNKMCHKIHRRAERKISRKPLIYSTGAVEHLVALNVQPFFKYF